MLTRAWRPTLLRDLAKDLVFGNFGDRGFTTKLPVIRECGRKFPKTGSFAKSLNKVERQARVSVPLLHEI